MMFCPPSAGKVRTTSLNQIDHITTCHDMSSNVTIERHFMTFIDYMSGHVMTNHEITRSDSERNHIKWISTSSISVGRTVADVLTLLAPAEETAGLEGPVDPQNASSSSVHNWGKNNVTLVMFWTPQQYVYDDWSACLCVCICMFRWPLNLS